MPPPLAVPPEPTVPLVPATAGEPAPPTAMPGDPLAPALGALGANEPPEDCGELGGCELHAQASRQHSQ
jgi:hypothetical protein